MTSAELALWKNKIEASRPILKENAYQERSAKGIPSSDPEGDARIDKNINKQLLNADKIYYKSQNKTTPSPVSVKTNSGATGITAGRLAAGITTSASLYTFTSSQYPEDLDSNKNEYGGHSVVFYINVPTESKFANDTSNTFVDMPSGGLGSRLAGLPQGQMIGGSAAVGGITALAAGGFAALGGGISNVVKKTVSGGVNGGAKAILGGSAKTIAGALGLAAVGGTAASIVTNGMSGIGRQKKRLKQAIKLYIPNNLIVRYGVEYSSEDTAIFSMGTKVGFDTQKALESLATSNPTAGGIDNMLSNLIISKMPLGGSLSAATGIAANPKKENIFRNVEFRNFDFQYTFFPKSSSESLAVMNIIQMFKYHMHPEFKDSDEFLFIFPSEFDIVYYLNGKENTKLHKHTSCVLTALSVNNTPNNLFNTFADGTPTQIDITLSFKELAILTKDQIQKGY